MTPENYYQQMWDRNATPKVKSTLASLLLMGGWVVLQTGVQVQVRLPGFTKVALDARDDLDVGMFLGFARSKKSRYVTSHEEALRIAAERIQSNETDR